MALDARGAEAPTGHASPSPLIDITGAEPQLRLVETDAATERSGLGGATPARLAAKRVIDVVGALVALVLLSPVLLLAAIAIKATSRGPIFYVQERVGQYGRTFRMVKFRSMCVDAHQRRAEVAHLNVHHDGPIFKIVDDPRVTRVGKVLRRFSIDELPQLFNVVTGSMSLVGPRPPLPEEVARYDEHERQRLLAKPGMTCIWQVSGRSDVDFATWVAMDLEYIRTWSLLLDLRLLLLTIPAVFARRGAY